MFALPMMPTQAAIPSRFYASCVWVSGFTVLGLACFRWNLRRPEESCQEKEAIAMLAQFAFIPEQASTYAGAGGRLFYFLTRRHRLFQPADRRAQSWVRHQISPPARRPIGPRFEDFAGSGTHLDHCPYRHGACYFCLGRQIVL